MSLLTIPSFAEGYAESADLSDAPGEWNGLLCAVAPMLGHQGNMLYDLSGYAATAAFTGITLATDWQVNAGGMGLNFDASDNRVVMTNPLLDNVIPFTYVWYGFVRSAGQGNFGVMFAKGTTGNANGSKRWVHQASGAIECSIERATTDAFYIASTGSVSYNTVSSIITTCDASLNLRCFVNGRETTYSSAPAVGSGAVQSDAAIGLVLGDWATTGGSGTHDGLMYEARMYNYVLPDALIAEIARDHLALYRFRRRRVGASAAAAPVGTSLVFPGLGMRHLLGR